MQPSSPIVWPWSCFLVTQLHGRRSHGLSPIFSWLPCFGFWFHGGGKESEGRSQLKMRPKKMMDPVRRRWINGVLNGGEGKLKHVKQSTLEVRKTNVLLDQLIARWSRRGSMYAAKAGLCSNRTALASARENHCRFRSEEKKEQCK